MQAPSIEKQLYTGNSQCNSDGQWSPGKQVTKKLPVMALCLVALVAATASTASPYVDGPAIRWSDDGWFQVQSATDYETVCEGGSSCWVDDGFYNVINLSTGERWENLRARYNASAANGGTGSSVTTDYANGVSESGGIISWTRSGWHQVQSKSDFSTLCEGGSSCAVPAGTYVVVNHDSGYRVDNIIVDSTGDANSPVSPTNPGSGPGTPSAGNDDFLVSGTRIEFQSNDWFQVQLASNYSTVCQGEAVCDLVAGTYNVINHSSGDRFNGVVLSGGGNNNPPLDDGSQPVNPSPVPVVAAPIASGNEILLSGDGYYQVQSAEDFSNVCEGNISSCEVTAGVYNVINHSINERWNGIRVAGTSTTPIPPTTPTPPTTSTPNPPRPTQPQPGTGLAYSINPSDPFNALLEFSSASAPASGVPSQPQNLRVELIGNNWVEFNWAPAVDDGEVVAYNIYRDSTAAPLYVLEKGASDPNDAVTAELEKLWETSSFIDCNNTRFSDRIFFCEGGPNGEAARAPEVGAQHTYYVSAVDDDGNESALSAALAVQLYDQTDAPLQSYEDPHLLPSNDFMFAEGVGSPANFLDRYELVFDEDFNGSELDASKWNSRLVWGPDVTINGEQQYFVDTLNEPDFGYDPFEFTGSTLKIVANKTPPALLARANGQRYLSGALSSFDKFGFTYGYTESRMRVSGVFGALSSFYLYHRYPGDHGPEIDINEYLGYNQYGDEDAFQTYHYRDSQFANNGLIHSSPTLKHRNESGALYADGFHTFGALWEPGLVVWYIDGVEVKRLHGPQIGRRQMNIISYLVTGSSWPKAPDEYIPSDDLVEMQDEIVNLPLKLEDDYPLEFEIDYIRVWQLPERVGN